MSRTRRAAAVVLTVPVLALAGCGDGASDPFVLPDGTSGARVFGRWEKEDDGLPPFSLEVRRTPAGDSGQVWLSGVTFTLPAEVSATGVVLAESHSSALAPVVGVLRPDGRLRVTFRGSQGNGPATEFVLARAR